MRKMRRKRRRRRRIRRSRRMRRKRKSMNEEDKNKKGGGGYKNLGKLTINTKKKLLKHTNLFTFDVEKKYRKARRLLPTHPSLTLLVGGGGGGKVEEKI